MSQRQVGTLDMSCLLFLAMAFIGVGKEGRGRVTSRWSGEEGTVTACYWAVMISSVGL